MIIWLASYPKSGNTWVRSMIASLIYTTDGKFNFQLLKKILQFPEKIYFKEFLQTFNDLNEVKKYWVLSQDKINLNNKINFLKTHHINCKIGNYPFTNKDNTAATIYIVRDPRNLIRSLSNHYSITNEESCKFLCQPKIIGNGFKYDVKKNEMTTLLGNWAQHYNSWVKYNNNLLVIRYEDLIADTRLQLEKIIFFLKKYLNFEINETKIENILNSTSFKSLQKMEEEGLFNENAINKKNHEKKKFFYLGEKNKWKTIKNQDLVQKIEKNFNDEMKKLKYLN